MNRILDINDKISGKFKKDLLVCKKILLKKPMNFLLKKFYIVFIIIKNEK